MLVKSCCSIMSTLLNSSWHTARNAAKLDTHKSFCVSDMRTALMESLSSRKVAHILHSVARDCGSLPQGGLLRVPVGEAEPWVSRIRAQS